EERVLGRRGGGEERQADGRRGEREGGGARSGHGRFSRARELGWRAPLAQAHQHREALLLGVCNSFERRRPRLIRFHGRTWERRESAGRPWRNRARRTAAAA